MLLIKKLSLQEKLPFQSQTTESTTTQYSKQSVLNSLENGLCSLIFHHPTCSYNHPNNPPIAHQPTIPCSI